MFDGAVTDVKSVTACGLAHGGFFVPPNCDISS